MRMTRAALVLFSALTLTFGPDSLAPDAVPSVGAVDFLDACTTNSDGGSWRWEAKTDPEVPGPNTPIRAMTVDQIIAWSPLSGDWHTPEMADAPRRQAQIRSEPREIRGHVDVVPRVRDAHRKPECTRPGAQRIAGAGGSEWRRVE